MIYRIFALTMFSIVAIPTAHAKVEQSYDVGLSGGFRCDSHMFAYFKNTAESALTVPTTKIEANHLYMGQLKGFAHAQLNPFHLDIEGDYARGSNKKASGTHYQIESPDVMGLHFHMKAKEKAYDVRGKVGYQFDLIKSGSRNLSLVPTVSYSVHRQEIQMKNQHPTSTDPSAISLGSGQFDFVITEKNWKKIWNGPSLGGVFHIDIANRTKVEIGYLYHWLELKESLFENGTIALTTPPLGTTTRSIRNSLSTKDQSAHGHYATARVYQRIGEHFRAGLRGNYFYADTTNQHINTSNSPVSMNTRWSSFSIEGEISVSF